MARKAGAAKGLPEGIPGQFSAPRGRGFCVGADVQVYSRSQKRWIGGQVVRVHQGTHDLTVQYGGSTKVVDGSNVSEVRLVAGGAAGQPSLEVVAASAQRPLLTPKQGFSVPGSAAKAVTPLAPKQGFSVPGAGATNPSVAAATAGALAARSDSMEDPGQPQPGDQAQERVFSKKDSLVRGVETKLVILKRDLGSQRRLMLTRLQNKKNGVVTAALKRVCFIEDDKASSSSGKAERKAQKKLKEAQEKWLKDLAKSLQASKNGPHPNVADCYDLFYEEKKVGPSHYCMASDFVEGHSLQDLVSRSGPFCDEDRLIRLMLQCLDGVHHIHAQGHWHGDLKLSNIRLIGAEETPKIVGYGDRGGIMCRDARHPGTIGTLEHTSPEVYHMIRHNATSYASEFLETGKASDLWAIGIGMFKLMVGNSPYEMVHGIAPNADRVQSTLAKLCARPPAMNLPELPPASTAGSRSEKLRAVVNRMLRSDPKARYPDVSSVRSALEHSMLTARLLPAGTFSSAEVKSILESMGNERLDNPQTSDADILDLFERQRPAVQSQQLAADQEVMLRVWNLTQSTIVASIGGGHVFVQPLHLAERDLMRSSCSLSLGNRGDDATSFQHNITVTQSEYKHTVQVDRTQLNRHLLVFDGRRFRATQSAYKIFRLPLPQAWRDSGCTVDGVMVRLGKQLLIPMRSSNRALWTTGPIVVSGADKTYSYEAEITRVRFMGNQKQEKEGKDRVLASAGQSHCHYDIPYDCTPAVAPQYFREHMDGICEVLEHTPLEEVLSDFETLLVSFAKQQVDIACEMLAFAAAHLKRKQSRRLSFSVGILAILAFENYRGQEGGEDWENVVSHVIQLYGAFAGMLSRERTRLVERYFEFACSRGSIQVLATVLICSQHMATPCSSFVTPETIAQVQKRLSTFEMDYCQLFDSFISHATKTYSSLEVAAYRDGWTPHIVSTLKRSVWKYAGLQLDQAMHFHGQSDLFWDTIGRDIEQVANSHWPRMLTTLKSLHLADSYQAWPAVLAQLLQLLIDIAPGLKELAHLILKVAALNLPESEDL
eukprot:COSAG01_NODE_6517_length_3624_cov_8.250873_2_plen_1052_part_01